MQLNANGTLKQVIVSGLHGASSLYTCANPANGHIFVAGGNCHKIWDVDPVAKTATVWLDNLASPAQMTFSEDGQMLFVAMNTNPGTVLGIDAVTKATIFDYAALNTTSPLNQPSGIAIGSGDLERDLFVTCGDGTVWQIDRGDATATLLASGGTRGQAARGSINSSLLVTQTDRISGSPLRAGVGRGMLGPGVAAGVRQASTGVESGWQSQVAGARTRRRHPASLRSGRQPGGPECRWAGTRGGQLQSGSWTGSGAKAGARSRTPIRPGSITEQRRESRGEWSASCSNVGT